MSLIPDSMRFRGRMTRLRLTLLLLTALALLLAATACGGLSTTTAPTTKPTTAAATTSPTTTATTAKPTTAATSTAKPTATATPAPTAAATTTIVLTEPQLAYIVSVSTTSPVTVQADYVEIYFGAEAIAMAKKDKAQIIETEPNGDEYIANDYYLRNTNPQLRTFPLATNCKIKVLPADGGAEATSAISAAKLRTLVGTRKRLMEITFNPAGTQIVGLTEFFVP